MMKKPLLPTGYLYRSVVFFCHIKGTFLLLQNIFLSWKLINKLPVINTSYATRIRCTVLWSALQLTLARLHVADHSGLAV
jgi:hypothetical protein